MATSIWTGTVIFGLVSIPVKVFSATTSHDVSFNLLHNKCRGRINLQNWCPQCEEVVPRSDLIKGYQYEKDTYVTVEEEDLASVRPESSSNMDILQFIEIGEVDPIYFEKTYYLGPDKGSKKTFALLTRAMEQTKRAAIGKLVMRNHEYLALIRPGMKGLVMHLMLYADEIRENENIVTEDTDLKDKEVQLARELINNLTEPFDASQIKSDYVAAMEEMLESKIKGRQLTVVKPKEKTKVIDLMEALQMSVKQSRMKRPADRADEEEKERPVQKLKKVK
ncbi:MAG TPA: Ku protein [Acidobacteriota bacterium]|nr:Ku protein [Acidobacteriota bacterium]